jgi:hypothetical protein
LVQAFLKKWWVESDFKAPNLPLSLRLTDFVCLYNYEFGLSLCKIVRSSVILLLPLFITCGSAGRKICISLKKVYFNSINPVLTQDNFITLKISSSDPWYSSHPSSSYRSSTISSCKIWTWYYNISKYIYILYFLFRYYQCT